MEKKHPFILRCCSGLLFCLPCISLCILPGCIGMAGRTFDLAPLAPQASWTPRHPHKKGDEPPLFQKEMAKYEALSKESPLSLEEIVDIALARNPTVRQTWAKSRESAARYGQSLQKRFIQADIVDTLDHSSAILPRDRQTTALEFSYTILDFGRTHHKSKAALQSLYSANWSHNRKVQELIHILTSDYYNYFYQKQLLVASEQDIRNAQLSLEATEEKYRRGLADLSEVARAKSESLQQKLNAIERERALQDAYIQLIGDMGLPPYGTLFFEEPPKDREPLATASLEALIAKARDNRPDLRASRADVEASLARVKAAEAQKFPAITATLQMRRTSHRHPSREADASIGLTLPLFRGFFLENGVKAARAALESARALSQQVEIEIASDVTRSWNSLLYAQRANEHASAYLESAEEEYRIQLMRYQMGTGTIIELIDAQTKVFHARALFARTQRDRRTSIADLLYSIGTLPDAREHLPTKEIGAE